MLATGAIGFGWVLLVGGCASERDGVTEGAPCATHIDCGPRQVCAKDPSPTATSFRTCVVECTSTAQCTAGRTCSESGDASSHLCLNACTQHDTVDDLVCENGTLVSCSVAQIKPCTICGCAGASGNPVCDTTTDQCGPPRELGAACTDDSDCASERCGDLSEKCEIPSGESCTGMEQFCGETCTASGHCLYTCLDEDSEGCDANSHCFGSSFTNTYYCAVSCNTAGSPCPWGGECEYYTGPDSDESNEGPWCFR
jgi:hypothetical protein